MDSITKKTIKDMFKSFIKKIDSGCCDSLSIEQLEKLIRGLELINEIDASIPHEKCKKWKIFGK